jgi:hypothetical protein
MTVYIAFVSSPELRRDSLELVKNIDARTSASQADLMTSIIIDFTDEILKVFFLDLTELLGLSHFMEKVVTGAVSTIKSTIHSVSRTVIHKLDNKQLIPLADYIRNIMLVAAAADGVEKPYIGFPISDATRLRMQMLVSDMKGSDPHTHVAELTDMLNEITDLALEAYLITPIELLKLGFILRKLSEGSVTIIRGAVHLMIRRLVPDLTTEHLQSVTEYLHDMVLLNGRPYR